MKNLLKSFLAIALTFTLFCCNNQDNPQPVSDMPDIVQDANAKKEDPDSGDKDKEVHYDISWHTVQYGVIRTGEGVNLEEPYTIGNFRGVDFIWKTFPDGRSALVPLSVTFLNTHQTDFKPINRKYLETHTFTADNLYGEDVNLGLAGDLFPFNMVVVRDAKGGYFMIRTIKMQQGRSIEVYIYQAVRVVVP